MTFDFEDLLSAYVCSWVQNRLYVLAIPAIDGVWLLFKPTVATVGRPSAVDTVLEYSKLLVLEQLEQSDRGILASLSAGALKHVLNT